MEKSQYEKYWNTVDPRTGKRFVIPYLKENDPAYMNKYVSYMKLREENPKEFERILNWS